MSVRVPRTLRLTDITLPKSRMRELDQRKVDLLAESIRINGLINRITVDDGFTLLAGAHRFAACQQLKMATIDVEVRPVKGLHRELIEIEENLTRAELTPLQQAEHAARRDEILEQLGLRASVKNNQHKQSQENSAGATVSPAEFSHKTTADLAAEMGISERGVQQRLQIAKGIAKELRDEIRHTPIAESTTQLVALARATPEDQRRAVDAVKSGKAKTVKDALGRKADSSIERLMSTMSALAKKLPPIIDLAKAAQDILSREDIKLSGRDADTVSMEIYLARDVLTSLSTIIKQRRSK